MLGVNVMKNHLNIYFWCSFKCPVWRHTYGKKIAHSSLSCKNNWSLSSIVMIINRGDHLTIAPAKEIWHQLPFWEIRERCLSWASPVLRQIWTYAQYLRTLSTATFSEEGNPFVYLNNAHGLKFGSKKGFNGSAAGYVTVRPISGRMEKNNANFPPHFCNFPIFFIISHKLCFLISHIFLMKLDDQLLPLNYPYNEHSKTGINWKWSTLTMW